MKNQTTYYLFLQEQNGDFWAYSSPNETSEILTEVTLPTKQRNLLCHKVASCTMEDDMTLCTFQL